MLMRLGPLPGVINSCSAARLTLKSFPSKWSAQPNRLKLDGRARRLLPLTDTLFFVFFPADLLASFPLFSSPSLAPRSAHCITKHTDCSFFLPLLSHFLLILDVLTLHRFLVSSLSFNVWTPLADAYWLSSQVILISRFR